MVCIFSKSKKERVAEKDGTKVKRKLQKHDSDYEKSAEERPSNKMHILRNRKGVEDDDSHSSEDVDISRGEGDVQSSSDEEDEGQLRLQITEVCT